jgi:hypothetical protein
MINRFYGHFFASLSTHYKWVLLLCLLYTCYNLLFDHVGTLAILAETVAVFGSTIVWLILAFKSHHKTLHTARPDAVSRVIPRKTKATFVGVIILVQFVIFILVSLMVGVLYGYFQDALVSKMLGGDFYGIYLIGILIPLSIPYAVLYMVMAPFIPRTLTHFHRPFLQQIRVNLAGSWRALGYYLIGPVFIYIMVLGWGFLTEYLLRITDYSDVMLTAKTLLLGIFEGIIEGILIIAAATAFSMHFLDTVKDETVAEEPNP